MNGYKKTFLFCIFLGMLAALTLSKDGYFLILSIFYTVLCFGLVLPFMIMGSITDWAKSTKGAADTVRNGVVRVKIVNDQENA